MKRFTWILFLLCIDLQATAQPFSFRNYSVEDGLPSSQIYVTAEDHLGQLWIGTYSSGITLFNGHEFTEFEYNAELPGHSVVDIVQGPDGVIWMGTDRGLARYDGREFSVVALAEGRETIMVRDLLMDRQGKLWVATQGDGLFCRDGSETLHFGKEDGLPSDKLAVVYEDHAGVVWAGCYGGLAKIVDRKLVAEKGTSELEGKIVLGIAEDQENHLWISAFGAGLFRYGQGKMEHFGRAAGLPTLRTVRCIVDAQGTVWAGTFSAGLIRGRNGQVSVFTEKDGIPSNQIFNLYNDRQGNIWLATGGGGIGRMSPTCFAHLSPEQDGLSDNSVLAILRTRDEKLYLGTEQGGLDVYENGVLRKVPGLESARINSIAEDSAGHLWIAAARKGLLKYDGQSVQAYGKKNGLIGGYASKVFIDQSGKIWVGSYLNGLFQFEDGRFRHDSLIQTSSVYAMTEDAAGALWVGAYGDAVYRIDATGYKRFDLGKEKGANQIFTLCEYPAGTMWVGSEGGGMFQIRDEKISQFGTAEGLKSNLVHALIPDGRGNLAIGYANGMDLLPLDQNGRPGTPRHYGKLAGFVGVECNRDAIFLDTAGVIWFGTTKGATRYEAALDIPQETPPHITIHNLRHLFEDRDWSDFSEGSSTWNPLPQNLRLPHDINHLTFDFAGVDLRAPEEVRYQFKLEGIDENWSPKTDRREATFSNLP
ncbi:MAG: two-component regulator propeller domain-containing protein, partial [Bacteroidota bacterium]